eukprot:2122815-Rhodomonas_salina.1
MVRIRQEQEEGGKRCDLADGPQAGAQKLGTYCVDAIIGLYFITQVDGFRFPISDWAQFEGIFSSLPQMHSHSISNSNQNLSA